MDHAHQCPDLQQLLRPLPHGHQQRHLRLLLLQLHQRQLLCRHPRLCRVQPLASLMSPPPLRPLLLPRPLPLLAAARQSVRHCPAALALRIQQLPPQRPQADPSRLRPQQPVALQDEAPARQRQAASLQAALVEDGDDVGIRQHCSNLNAVHHYLGTLQACPAAATRSRVAGRPWPARGQWASHCAGDAAGAVRLVRHYGHRNLNLNDSHDTGDCISHCYGHWYRRTSQAESQQRPV